jgi:tungstate transport system substrate-binding protein
VGPKLSLPAAMCRRVTVVAWLLSTALPWAAAQERVIVMASTTSTEQSGLFAHLLPAFTQATGIKVKVVALGTGQALDMGRRGDADLLLVHDKAAEEQFVAEGHSVARWSVMHNDFVLVGPKSDAAGIKGKDVVAALKKLASSPAVFVSRADKSGTHAAELRAWRAAGLDMPAGKPNGYKACGCGMGPALNVAASLDGHTLADRGTWISFKNKGNLAVLVEGDARLFNPYGVMVVNPAKHPHVKREWAQAFVDWVLSKEGQARIANFKIGGEPLFFPNAAK